MTLWQPMLLLYICIFIRTVWVISVFYCASDMIITSQVICARGLSTDSLYEIWAFLALTGAQGVTIFVRSCVRWKLSRTLNALSLHLLGGYSFKDIQSLEYFVLFCPQNVAKWNLELVDRSFAQSTHMDLRLPQIQNLITKQYSIYIEFISFQTRSFA